MSSSAEMPARADSPLALRHIAFTFDNAQAEQSAMRLVERYSPQWTTEPGGVRLTQFTDGITNVLIKATRQRPDRTAAADSSTSADADVDAEAVLMRAYGQGTDVLIDRERELRAHHLLAGRGLAPPLLARFDNGFVYGFVVGKVCTAADLRHPDVYRPVARRLAQWHATLPISAIATMPILDASSTPAPSDRQKHLAPPKNDGDDHDGDDDDDNGDVVDGQSTNRPFPNTWTVLQQWIQSLPESTEVERERKRTLRRESTAMSARLGDAPGLEPGREYVFAHHDLLCGNVIVDETAPGPERPVSFIDYEYATPGAAAFDIANHFAEWAGYDCEHAAVPSRSQRFDFLRHYAASYRHHFVRDHGAGAGISPEIDLQKDVDFLYAQVEEFRGMPGLFWGVWGLIQATISQIDFDYATYADLRLSEYWAWKEESDGSRVRQGREMHVREKKWQSE